VLPAGDIALGGYLLLGMAIAITISWLLRELKGRVMAYLSGRIEYILGTSVFQRVVNLPASSTEGASVSRQVGRIKGLESLRTFFHGPLATLAFDLPAVLIMILAIAIIKPVLISVVLISVFAYIILGLVTRGLNKRAVVQSTHFSSLSWDFLNEALTNMRAIRAVGARKLWVSRYKELSAKATMANFRNQRVQSYINSVTQVLGASTGLLILAMAAVLAIRGEITGGAMIATMMLVWRVTGPIQNIVLSAASLVRIRTTMNQVENLMRLKGERDGGVRQTIRPEIHGSIGFSRVSFRYANDADPALLGVTFSIKAGQVVVIAGPNGAGKSTLLKLLDRVYLPQAGIIRLDNIDIRQLNIADLRSRISYMPQNIEVFYGTVAQNLLLADPAATDAEMRWAVEMAGLMDDIQALPQGFETRISNSRSDQLPQGFRQRLSLARTILKPASVVLLDEPGAGMDQAGEEALIRCIQYLRGRTTVLITSHRPGHMRLADTVIYMERGAVTAMGSFEQITDKVMAGLR
jgi:ABC-type bacteriocin/lantibiotic exporter with double-glycine peptidase domain